MRPFPSHHLARSDAPLLVLLRIRVPVLRRQRANDVIGMKLNAVAERHWDSLSLRLVVQHPLVGVFGVAGDADPHSFHHAAPLGRPQGEDQLGVRLGDQPPANVLVRDRKGGWGRLVALDTTLKLPAVPFQRSKHRRSLTASERLSRRRASASRRPARRARCEISANRACWVHSRCVGAAATEQHESFSVPRVGVDTVSFAWRPTGDELLWRRLRGGAEDGHICGLWQVCPAGVVGGWMLKKKLGAASWFFYPDNELIYCEGRLGAMLADDLRDFSLGPFFSLGIAAHTLEEVFAPVVGRDREDGISDDPGRVRRLDLAAELRWSDPADGIAALDALADLTLPRVKVCEWRHEGRTETIAYYTAAKKKRLLHRIYDKGVQSGSDPAGTLLRFERQHRFEKAKQQLAEEVAWQGNPEALWLDGFEDWAQAAESLNVAGPDAAQRHLIEKVESGELQREKAERLIGSLAVARLRGEGWWRDLGKPHLGRRRRRELADHGLALAPSAKSQPEVPLGEAIRALRTAWREPTSGQAKPGSGEPRAKRERDATRATAQDGRTAS